MRNDILSDKFWNKYWAEGDAKPRNRRVYDWLNGDNFYGIYSEGDTAWYELVTGYCPDYCHNILVKFIKQNSLKYLYDEEEGS